MRAALIDAATTPALVTRTVGLADLDDAFAALTSPDDLEVGVDPGADTLPAL